MKPTKAYENKKILVLGLARSGVSAAKLLHQLGALVTVNDAKEFAENPEAQDLLTLGIRVITGSHPVDLLDEDFTLIVKNPGIRYTNPILEKAIEKGLKIITEVELAYQICEGTIIAITGTNGKTTSTTMIGAILNHGLTKGQAYLAGNIGAPASTVAQQATKDDLLVTELSSFQLMGIQQFAPKVALITNLYEAHLDYHGTREEYVAAKWRIQENMNENDLLILNGNQAELAQLGATTKAKTIYFSTDKKLPEGAYLNQGNLFYKDELIMSASDLGVPGEHNIENALGAIIVAKYFGMTTAAISQSLKDFKGVEHRTEFVATIAGRKFYNDSKATNLLATEKALSGFDTHELILLAGGLDRGNDFLPLVPALVGLKGIILFGESRFKLKEAAEKADISEIHLVETLAEAVSLSWTLSTQDTTILLSPACASWDQFKNFEIRGQLFKEAVKQIKNAEVSEL